MMADELRARTKQSAGRILKLANSLPRSASGLTLPNQIAASGTSVVAYYRAACRASSKRKLMAKLGIAEKEADETQLWIELIIEAGVISGCRLQPLHDEAGELTAVIAASRKTAATNQLATCSRKSAIP